MTAPMDLEQIWQAIVVERAGLADLLGSLAASGWDHPSLCDGWRVRDVAAHLIQATRLDVPAIAMGLIRARGNLDRAIRDSAIRYADARSTPALLAEFRDSVGSRAVPFGTTPADRLMDLLLHGQDIAIPLGITREMPTAAAVSALRRIWETGAPFHARRRFAGYRLTATDSPWSAGTGLAVEGPSAALLLLISGRSAALDRITGEGATRLRQ
ncbi:maleylpyruvate isomerase family mycothiol-dependent enzyme [Nocardia spumae]|uniref:maleylpyruvate isomerase family mycothiol-dependent enzyme n=1 Tax=Nocardia spumae TaxID=2887190 RepID=UPI001D13EC67|nr:maleylpyruvate isomerase family mycothiol-dependent enzyme [Nocardia spumae]